MRRNMDKDINLIIENFENAFLEKIENINQDAIIDDIISEKDEIIRLKEIELERVYNSIRYRFITKIIKICRKLPFFLPIGKKFLLIFMKQ
jgi:hypothetical protein